MVKFTSYPLQLLPRLINCLSGLFANYRLPHQLVSDNVPQFYSVKHTHMKKGDVGMAKHFSKKYGNKG